MVLGHAHVGIKVADLSRSVQFYQTHFGFTAGKYNELHRENKITKIQFLELGQFSLELVENPGYPGGEPSPQIHLAFGVDDYDRTIQSMREAGVAFESDVPRGEPGSRIIFLAGPDGDRLELMER